jgi:hypothetical protein
MGKVINGQVIASTAVDSHGEALSEEAIRTFFAQLKDPSVSFRNHDTSQVPVCRGFNKRLEWRPDGSLAIVIDLEVLDEAAFATAGGFSIAFTSRTVRFGTNPALRILINPRQLDFDPIAQDVGRLLPEGTSVDVTERIEKAAVPSEVIIIVSFVAGAIATGFMNKVGSDLFDYLKKRRARENPAPPTIHLHVTCEIQRRPVILLLVADPRATPAETWSRRDVRASPWGGSRRSPR